MGFDEALETGADLNVIARMSEDCPKGIVRLEEDVTIRLLRFGRRQLDY